MIQLLHVIHFQLLSNAQTLKTASPNRHRRLDMGELSHHVVLRRCKQQRRGDDKTYCYPSQSFVCLIVPVSCVFEGIGSHWNTISMVACHSYSIHIVGATTAYIWGKTWILRGRRGYSILCDFIVVTIKPPNYLPLRCYIMRYCMIILWWSLLETYLPTWLIYILAGIKV